MKQTYFKNVNTDMKLVTGIKTLLLATFLVFNIVSVKAQTGNENFEKTSFDSEDKVYLIDAITEKRISLFPEINNFKLAEVFQSDKQYMIDVQTSSSTNHIKMYLKDDEFYKIQKKVDAYLKSKSVVVKEPAVPKVTTPVVVNNPQVNPIFIDKESGLGRRKLRKSAAALAFGAYGWMLPIGFGAFDHRDDETIDGTFSRVTTSVAGSYLLMTGAGILIPYFATSNTEIPLGAATLYGGASSIGLMHGALLYLALDKDYDKPRYINGVFLTSIGVSVAEGVIGYSFGKANNITAGHAKMISSNGLWAIGAGASAAQLLGLFKDKEASPAGFATTLGVSLAGYVVGNAFARNTNCTLGDARVYNTILPLTMFTGFSAVLAQSSPPNPNTLATVALISYGTGMLIGHNIIATNDFTTKKANVIIGGTMGGALLGLGANLLANAVRVNTSNTNGTTSSTDDGLFPAFRFNERTPLFIAVGAVGGFTLAYVLQQNAAKKAEKGTTGMLNMELSPIMAPRTSFSSDKILPGMKINYTF